LRGASVIATVIGPNPPAEADPGQSPCD